MKVFINRVFILIFEFYWVFLKLQDFEQIEMQRRCLKSLIVRNDWTVSLKDRNTKFMTVRDVETFQIRPYYLLESLIHSDYCVCKHDNDDLENCHQATFLEGDSIFTHSYRFLNIISKCDYFNITKRLKSFH